jgi:hypothetical protein
LHRSGATDVEMSEKVGIEYAVGKNVAQRGIYCTKTFFCKPENERKKN